MEILYVGGIDFNNSNRYSIIWKGTLMDERRPKRTAPSHAKGVDRVRSWIDGRPRIAIANVESDLTTFTAHVSEVATSLRNGVYERGGIPLELHLPRWVRPSQGQLRC